MNAKKILQHDKNFIARIRFFNITLEVSIEYSLIVCYPILFVLGKSKTQWCYSPQADKRQYCCLIKSAIFSLETSKLFSGWNKNLQENWVGSHFDCMTSFLMFVCNIVSIDYVNTTDSECVTIVIVSEPNQLPVWITQTATLCHRQRLANAIYSSLYIENLPFIRH